MGFSKGDLTGDGSLAVVEAFSPLGADTLGAAARLLGGTERDAGGVAFAAAAARAGGRLPRPRFGGDSASSSSDWLFSNSRPTQRLSQKAEL